MSILLWHRAKLLFHSEDKMVSQSVSHWPGYADLENPVFFRETTQMLLGAWVASRRFEHDTRFLSHEQ